MNESVDAQNQVSLQVFLISINHYLWIQILSGVFLRIRFPFSSFFMKWMVETRTNMDNIYLGGANEDDQTACIQLKNSKTDQPKKKPFSNVLWKRLTTEYSAILAMESKWERYVGL